MFPCDFSIAGFDNSSVVQAKVVKQLVFDVDKGLLMYRDFCAIEWVVAGIIFEPIEWYRD